MLINNLLPFITPLSFVFILAIFPASAQSRTNILPSSDPRGPSELTLCSQNLENYGLLESAKARRPGMTQSDLEEKEIALVRRFAKAGCDVIALQEVLGKTDQDAELALEKLAQAAKKITSRIFAVKVGPTLDNFSHVGFMVAKDRAEIITQVAYSKVELPKFTEKEKPRLFARAPLELQVLIKPLDGSSSRTMTLINIHFKSRRGGSGDPAALEWETFRMQMAEAIRRIVENRHSKALNSGEALLAVLGDRNSHFDVASAKILEGSLRLSHFTEQGVCRLSKRGVPLCQIGNLSSQKLFSVLTSDPVTKLLPGTFTYEGEYSWLDEILLPAASLRYAWREPDSLGQYSSGVIYDPKSASDHALVYVKLNW